MSNDNETPRPDASIPDYLDGNAEPDPKRLRTVLLLTGFQRDLLFVIADLAGTNPSGSDIETRFDADFMRETSHGTLYRNLRDLHDQGLIDRLPRDGRTYSFRLTDESRADLESYLCWATRCMATDERGLRRCQSNGGGPQ